MKIYMEQCHTCLEMVMTPFLGSCCSYPVYDPPPKEQKDEGTTNEQSK